MIQHRNPVLIPVLFIVTLGIYGLVWFYKTSDELIRYNKQSDNPLLWLLLALVPILNIIPVWWHAQATAKMSASGKSPVNGVVLFVLWLIFPVGIVITQALLNSHAGEISGDADE